MPSPQAMADARRPWHEGACRAHREIGIRSCLRRRRWPTQGGHGMSALSRVVRSGVGRRRVQTVVIGLVVMLAVTAAVLGGSLMLASSSPFDRAFAQQRGAHLTAQFDATKVTASQIS